MMERWKNPKLSTAALSGDFPNPRPPAGGVDLRAGFGSAQHSEFGVSLFLAGWQESLLEQGRAAVPADGDTGANRAAWADPARTAGGR